MGLAKVYFSEVKRLSQSVGEADACENAMKKNKAFAKPEYGF
jgi:hypothetical protein